MLAALQTGFRPREERITVLIPSRMRVESQWCDVVIHNVSSRGLMAGCDTPPAVGSYVEIRRGTIVNSLVRRTAALKPAAPSRLARSWRRRPAADVTDSGASA